MGTLAQFDLPTLALVYRLKHFVETGTGLGNSLAVAAASEAHFVSLHSCEIETCLQLAAMDRFESDPRVQVRAGYSYPFLIGVCATLPQDEPILFWLDAHFPGADFGLRKYDSEPISDIRLPLEQELHGIRDRRLLARDVILIDDLRIYEDGAYQHGNLPQELRPLCPRTRSIAFIEELFGHSHDIKRDYAHEGYLILTPKGTTYG